MVYSVRIYRACTNGEAVAESPVHQADTEGEAIAIGIAQVDSSPNDGQLRVFEVHDAARRLILSYTSESKPIPIAPGRHPDWG